MNILFNTAVAAAALALSASACAQITFYENEGFRGRVHSTRGALDNFRGWDFNDRASSVVVEKGRWEVCEGVGFTGRCAVLRPGRDDRLGTMGPNEGVTSTRPAAAGSPGLVGHQIGGSAHRIPMNAEPGPTVTVNQRGEPRM